MFIRHILLASVAVLIGTPALFADYQERGRKSIARLFVPTAAKALKATVRITSSNKDVGYGAIVDPAGLIITKASELRKGTTYVTLYDDTKYEAKVIRVDDATDLAMLKIDAMDLPVLTFTSPKSTDVGDWVASVTFGDLAVGVVSAAPRKLYGVESLRVKLNKGFMGIVAAADTRDMIEGVVIGGIERRGGAFRAKMKIGDIILKVGTTAIKKFDDLSKALEEYSPGEVVKVLYRRGEEEKETDVTLIGNEEFDRAVFQNKMGGGLSNRRTGFPEVLMHDTVIAPEECGSPLIDLEGRVLGLNIARAGRVETWALPGNLVTKVVEEMKAGKYSVEK